MVVGSFAFFPEYQQYFHADDDPGSRDIDGDGH